MAQLIPIFAILAGNLPLLLVLFTGGALALIWQDRAPRACRLLLIACVAEVLLIAVQAIVHGGLLPRLVNEGGLSSSQISIYYSVVGLSFNIVDAGLFALVIWAVFAGRGERTEDARPAPHGTAG
ncbi:hypothetical protein [Luteimonas aquatica]|uniref:hypothetical protein n=1 Tax=Luteimonas aquatica TaxID=450364 RepID=UPI001F57697C|nr:hypothetical protein [Luteimonas aquatica]